MMEDGFTAITETDRRNLYIEAAAEVIPLTFRSYPIKSAFRRAGLYPPTATPVLNNPCVTNQPIPITKATRTNVNISQAMLMDVDDMPKRKAATLAARAEAAQKTRARNKASAAAAAMTSVAAATAITASAGTVDDTQQQWMEDPMDVEQQKLDGKIDEDEKLFVEEFGDLVITPTPPAPAPAAVQQTDAEFMSQQQARRNAFNYNTPSTKKRQSIPNKRFL